MKTDLNVYKRKIYIPKDIKNFPDNGKVIAYVASNSMLVLFREDSDVRKELNAINLLVESDLNGNKSN